MEVSLLNSDNPAEQDEIIETLCERDHSQLAALAERLATSDSPIHHSFAIAIIETIKPPLEVEAADVFSELLKSPDTDIRERTVLASDILSGDAFTQVLRKAFLDNENPVRLATLEVLIDRDEDERLNVLDSAISANYEDLVLGAISILQIEDSPSADNSLTKALSSKNARIVKMAETALLIRNDLETSIQSALRKAAANQKVN